MSNKDIKIDHVASAAGVSKATISRYLNGKFEYMSDETKERIGRIIQELGYRPSNIARSLKAEKSGMLGCVVSDITNPFSSMLFKGISDVCEKKNYRVLFSHSSQDANREIECVEAFLDNRVDGLIVHTTSFNCEYLYNLKEKGLKIVLADLVFPAPYLFDSVSTNNYASSYECVRHLCEQGYRRVAFFADGGLSISSHQKRYEGYLDAMRTHIGDACGDCRYENITQDIETTKHQIKDFLGREPDIGPKAIFTVNGMSLYRVLCAMRDMGIEINGNPGVCGFDGWGWTPLVGPGITNIRQNAFDVGVQATNLLLSRIDGSCKMAEQKIELPNELIIKGSTLLK